MCEYKFGDYILPTDHLSASSLGVFKRCERQYKFRYVDGITLPASYAQASGSILHACLQSYFEGVMAGSRPRADDLGGLAADACENYVDHHETDMTSENRGSLEPTVRSALLDYIESVGKDVVPLATEDGFITKMRCGVPIMGFIDLKLRRGDDVVIGDYKFTGKKWTGSNLVNSL
ncbi:MAG: PD-(D/E)XK nuclease family protein [Mailhella sp.]|nr:PD-(D/E)XK nuclease family protein [Mailhella sp.]